jgi:hypothetical protein
MRRLYAIIAGIVIALTTTTSGISQTKSTPKEAVTRTVLGCTLGVSNIDQAIETITSKGGSISDVNTLEIPGLKVFLATNLVFAGEPGMRAIIQFLDNTLAFIGFFIDSENDASRIKTSLSNKYKGWKDNGGRLFEPYTGRVKDDKTEVSLFYYYEDDHNLEFKNAMLVYSDVALFRKIMQLKDSDL